jgi:hypothetical protein
MEKTRSFQFDNVAILVNNDVLHGVMTFSLNEVYANGNLVTQMSLTKACGVDEHIVNFMRAASAFELRILNKNTLSGYKTVSCTLDQFSLVFSPSNYLEQVMLIKVSSPMLYVDDARTVVMIDADKGDYSKLVDILKKVQVEENTNEPIVIISDTK